MSFMHQLILVCFFMTLSTFSNCSNYGQEIDERNDTGIKSIKTDHVSKISSSEEKLDQFSERTKREEPEEERKILEEERKGREEENWMEKEKGEERERSKKKGRENEQTLEQMKRLEMERLKCHDLELENLLSHPIKNSDQKNEEEGKVCPVIWDGALCWPSTGAGITVSKKCPVYVHGFNHKGSATRTCMIDGSWQVSESTNNSWTNYSQCMTKSIGQSLDDLLPNTINNNYQFENHIGRIKLITKTGYSVSLASLCLAFIILTGIKRLRCPRNSLHLQLFVSFMIRSAVFLIKSAYFTPDPLSKFPGLGDANAYQDAKSNEFIGYGTLSDEGAKSVEMTTDAKEIFFRSTSTTSCKVFTVIWQYSLIANYNWILMEGIYLHNLIFLHIFNDNSSIIKYVIAGWGLPLVFIIPWTFVRALFEDTLCWTTNQNLFIFWIIRGPVTLSIIMNAIFFVRITRVVFLKMFMAPPTRPSDQSINNNNNLGGGQSSHARMNNYKRWFRSTLVLVPLFGVHHIFLLLFNSLSLISGNLEITWLYVDLLFTSFQGFFVALLYCFLNGEVQSEVKKWWTIHKPTIFDHRSLHRLGGHGCHGNHGNNGNGNHGGHMNGNGQNNFPHSMTYNSLLTQSMNHLAGKIMMTSSSTLPNISSRGSHLVENGRTQSNPHVHSFPRRTSGHGDLGVMDMVLLDPVIPKSCGASPIGHELLEPLVSKTTFHESPFNKDGH